MLDEVNVKRIAGLTAFVVHAVGPVEVRFDLYVGALPRRVLPACQQISAGGIGGVGRLRLGSWRERGDRDPLSAPHTVNITLHSEGILLAALPVRTESHLSHTPLVECFPIGVKFRPANGTYAVNTIVEILPH